MEIKDLAGLSEPITKLIDVCSKGLGNISEPYLIKKRAEAKAYEIETITKALHTQKEIGLLPHTAYSNGELEIITDPNQNTSNDFALIQNEILERKYFQEVKKQGNINNTINFTMHELEDETEVSNESVDEDWIARFFNTIENISNEQMQQLWAKILAGEIKQPNSYSLRTLDLLKNLSFKEAEMFSKVASFAISGAEKMFILSDNKILKDKLDISFSDLLLLQDLDLIHSTQLNLAYDVVPKTKAHMVYGNELIEIQFNDSAPAINLPVYVFTIIGTELLKLVDIPKNLEYISEIAKAVKTHNSTKVLSCPIESKTNCEYNPELLKEVV